MTLKLVFTASLHNVQHLMEQCGEQEQEQQPVYFHASESSRF